MRTTFHSTARTLGSKLLTKHFFATRLLATLFLGSLLLAAGAAASPRQYIDKDQLPPDFVPSGKQMFIQYCAACHGLDAKGNGPARASLKIPASDLTTLAKRHDGIFPEDYVTKVLQFGPGFTAHGSSDMPTWGSIFRYMDNYNQAAVQKRIKNLCDYLSSLQVK
jgi:mono/diheme cytochrome c family protein